MRRLGLSIDPANAPKLHLFAWNVGGRSPAGVAAADGSEKVTIVDIITQAEMRTLASAYFEKVHPCYGFIERDTFFQHVGARWHARLPTAGPYDPVLCGVAALGSFFSRSASRSVEERLAALAEAILSGEPVTKPPSIDRIVGWICRVVYLRLTAAPLVAWMASCTAMHLIEAAGIHREASSSSVLLTASDCNYETRRRLFGVAQHLNTWISFDLSMSRVALHGAASSPPPPRPGDYTDKVLTLLPMSTLLDPVELQDDAKLKAALLYIVNSEDEQPPLIMAQCNLLLCILRRTYNYGSLTHDTADPPIDFIFDFMRKALRAAESLVATHSPWHHVANIPFQIVCLLLGIDSRASIKLLREAMQTLLHVAAYFDTSNLREAYSTACLLLWLYQKRRAEDVEMINGILTSYSSRPSVVDPQLSAVTPVMANNGEQQAWMNDLTASMSDFNDLDLDQLLSTSFFA